jgi:hypothetical protein
MSGDLACAIARGLGGDLAVTKAVTILGLSSDSSKSHDKGGDIRNGTRGDTEISLFTKGRN